MSSSVVGSFGGSFFTWFQEEVLPYLIGTLYIIVLILGIVLNSIMITTIRKRNLLEIRTNKFVFELTILDLISLIGFIFPAIIVAFMRNWKLSNYVCQIHGTVFTMCHMSTFGLLIAMSVERAVRAKNFDLHDRFFLRSRSVTWISILVWVVSLGIATIPQTGWVSISYDFYQAACIPSFRNNVYYLSIVFTFGLGFCFIAYFVTYSLIFSARLKKLKKPKPDDNKSGSNNLMSLMSKKTAENDKPASNNLMALMSKNTNASSNSTSVNIANNGVAPSTTATPKIGWSASNNQTSQSTGSGKPQSKFASLRARDKMKKVITKVKVSKLFSDDDTDPDFHLAVTYFIVACLMVFLWLPYFIVSFVSVNDKDLWGGFFSIVSVIAMISYCLKPIIYLAHNRHYQSVTKDTMPEKVVEKANKVRSSINEAINKLDKVMFKSTPAQKKFNATIKTTIVAKGWLGRARKNLNAKAGGLAGKAGNGNKTAIEMLALNKIKEDPENKTKNDDKTVANKTEDQTNNKLENKVVTKPTGAAAVTSSVTDISKQNSQTVNNNTKTTKQNETKPVNKQTDFKQKRKDNEQSTLNDTNVNSTAGLLLTSGAANKGRLSPESKKMSPENAKISPTGAKSNAALTNKNVSEESQPITKDRALPVKIPMNSIEEDAEGTHVQNKNMTNEFQQDDTQANSHAAKGVTHAAQGINHATQGVSHATQGDNQATQGDSHSKQGGGQATQGNSHSKQGGGHAKLLQKKDSNVDFHYAHVDTGEGSTPVIINANDGFSESPKFESPHRRQRGLVDRHESVNILPSVPETTYNSEKANTNRSSVAEYGSSHNNSVNVSRFNSRQDNTNQLQPMAERNASRQNKTLNPRHDITNQFQPTAERNTSEQSKPSVSRQDLQQQLSVDSYGSGQSKPSVSRQGLQQQMSVDSYGSGQSNDNVFYPSQKRHARDNEQANQYRPNQDNNMRNTISVPPPTDSNPISGNVRNNDPPYTDRNGYDPRTLQNDNPPNREMNLPNNRSVGNIPTGNGGKTEYNGRRRNTYQPSFLNDINNHHLNNSNSVSRRMSQIVDVPSQINNNSNPLPLDFI